MSGPTKPSRDPRFEAAFRVRYRTMDDLVVAYSKNLSKGGLFLRTEKFLPKDSIVRLHLELPDHGGELLVECRVAYIHDPKNSATPDRPAGMGIQFLDHNDESRKRIEQFIAEFSVDHAPPPLSSGRPPKPLVVLVVDDDTAYCKVAEEPFRRRGDTVRVAHDGIDALAICIKETPDVILCDVQMPRMDGWQFLRVIRSRPALAKVPFVFLTTLGSEADRLRGYRLGVDDYIPKPYRPQEVVSRADRAVERATKKRSGIEERSSLRGEIEQVSLPSVLAFLDMEKKSGVLHVEAGTNARIVLREGAPIRIETDGLQHAQKTQKEILFSVLDATAGRFVFSAEEVTGTATITASTTALLLEHAQRRDESRRSGSKAP